MGKQNQERRAAKKRRDGRRRGPDRVRSGWADHPGGSPSDRSGPGRSETPPGRSVPDFRYVLITAARAAGGRATSGPPDDLRDVLIEVARHNSSAAVSLIVDEVFAEGLSYVWEGGWQPAEVARAVRRRRSSLHSDLAVTSVAAAHARIATAPPPEWSAQLRDLDAETQWWGSGRDWLGPWALRSGLSWTEGLLIATETLGVILHLPVIESILPPPSQWSAGVGSVRRSGAVVDDAVLDKVRALLAKAEGTTFQHEADAFTAKAQEMMARHAIDEALARGTAGHERRPPVVRRVAIDDPYSRAKGSLLAGIAAANGVRSVWDSEFAHMTVIGFEADLEAVDLLFTSLLMQASKAMLSKGRVVDPRGRSRTRSYRQSFYLAFAGRIGERLAVATRQARVDAEREIGSEILPVLAGRQEEIDEATTRMFPKLRKGSGLSITNEDGFRAGRVAAELATLGPIQERLDVTG